MAGRFQRHLERGRRSLHDVMKRPALIFVKPAQGEPFETFEAFVRVHDQWQLLGDLKGTNFNYAEVTENSPKVIFMPSEDPDGLLPERGMYISISSEQMYIIDRVDPPNDITYTAYVSRLSKPEMVGMPYPGWTP